MTRAEEEYVETLAIAAMEAVKQLAREPSVAAQAVVDRQVIRKLCQMYAVTLVVSPAA